MYLLHERSNRRIVNNEERVKATFLENVQSIHSVSCFTLDEHIHIHIYIYICIYTYTSWYEEREIYVTLRRRNERKSGESYRRRTNLWRSRCEIVGVIGFQQVSQRDDRARIP